MLHRVTMFTRFHILRPAGVLNGRGCRAFSQPCWSCGGSVRNKKTKNFVPLACDSCGIIQPIPKDASLFALLGTEPSFDVDLADLEARFRNRQRALHPDLYTLKPENEQELSASASAAVNRAYQVLKNPMARLRYILELEGNSALSESAGSSGSISDPMFLSEIMDLRDDIENCSSHADMAEFRKHNQKQIQSSIGIIKELYLARDIDALASEAVKLQYYTKIGDEIEEAAEKF